MENLPQIEKGLDTKEIQKIVNTYTENITSHIKTNLDVKEFAQKIKNHIGRVSEMIEDASNIESFDMAGRELDTLNVIFWKAFEIILKEELVTSELKMNIGPLLRAYAKRVIKADEFLAKELEDQKVIDGLLEIRNNARDTIKTHITILSEETPVN